MTIKCCIIEKTTDNCYGGESVRKKLIRFRGNRTQAEMADKYGVSQQLWSRWELGHGKPNVVIIKKIEKDSGIPMEKIFSDIFHNK